jgi:hypothetical protein
VPPVRRAWGFGTSVIVTVVPCSGVGGLSRPGSGRPDESVELVAVVKGHPSPWAEYDAYHWVLRRPRGSVHPVPRRGHLDLDAACAEHLELNWSRSRAYRPHRAQSNATDASPASSAALSPLIRATTSSVYEPCFPESSINKEPGGPFGTGAWATGVRGASTYD